MRILGIDPGYATIGFGLITAERAQVHMVTYGAITTPAGLPLSRRLYQIDRDTGRILEQIPVNSQADYIIRKDDQLFVRTYDTNYVFQITQ